MNDSEDGPLRSSAQAVGGEDWKNTLLAGLANYIDGGSIVAGSAALALWVAAFHLSPAFVGLIGAFSANAISAGVGALVGGWLCDRIGRKKIYQYDMLFYAFGMLWLVCAVRLWMLSWSASSRGWRRHSGVLVPHSGSNRSFSSGARGSFRRCCAAPRRD